MTLLVINIIIGVIANIICEFFFTKLAAATCMMSASLIAPKDVNRSSMHSSWAPGVGGGGTSSRKGERSFNTSLQATAGGAKAQLESSGIEKSFKQRKSFGKGRVCVCLL